MTEKRIDIVDFENALTNYVLVDGVTPEIIKRKYIWLLNAIVENAIIGQDDYGLVWYSGDWIAGEWEDGTWCSGIWHDGEWKNGKWYSHRYDTKQLLQRNKRILEKDNPENSQFRHGIWRRGEFYNGYFGSKYFNETWKYKSYIECVFYETRWEGGTFFNGVFRNATWHNGIFKNGIFYNSEWIDGKFLNGTFEGYMWWNGSFAGGDFILGEWMNGKFSQGDPEVKSRFGSKPLIGTNNMAGTSVIWNDGEFINGEFHSGLSILSGVTSTSDNHNRTVWKNGVWHNGTWYGGTHVDGEFNNGYWFEGFWSGGTFNNGYWWNGFWLNGTVNKGYFVQGTFQNVTFNHGLLGFESPPDIVLKEISSRSGFTLEPNYLLTTPSIITEFVTGITQYTATCYCNATDDGGSPITQKGICWSAKSYFLFNEPDTDYTINGSGIGSFIGTASELDRGKGYYIKAYAKNNIGTAYGEEIYFTTTWF